MSDDIRCEATLDHRPALVWKAITDPALLRTWLMEGTFAGPTVGHLFEFRDRPRPFWDGICRCEVSEAEAPRRFTLCWGIGSKHGPSLVSWELEPAGEGRTRVRFRHSELHGFMGWGSRKRRLKQLRSGRWVPCNPLWRGTHSSWMGCEHADRRRGTRTT